MRHTTRELDTGSFVHRWEPATTGTPRGAVVVQHGFGEYAERYVTLHNGLIGHLVDAGLEVWALDLWGHGRSPGRRGVCHIGRAVRDHRQVVTLAAEAGRPVVAVGHSLGGLITAASAASLGDVLGGVVLLSSALPAPMGHLGRRALGIAARIAPAAQIPLRRRPLDELTHHRAVVDRTASDVRMHDGQIGFQLAATALDAMDSLRASAEYWTLPCLIIHGSADTYTDPQGSRAWAAQLAPHATIWVVDGGYHELLHDTDADKVLGGVVDFVDLRTS